MKPAPYVTDSDIDVSSEICPMTFVRTRLALDALLPGQTLGVLLAGEEPLRNVPRTATAQGHDVLALEPAQDGRVRVVVRRGERLAGR